MDYLGGVLSLKCSRDFKVLIISNDAGKGVLGRSDLGLMAAAAAFPMSQQPSNYDEISMQQSLLFSDSLKVPSYSACIFVYAFST